MPLVTLRDAHIVVATAWDSLNRGRRSARPLGYRHGEDSLGLANVAIVETSAADAHGVFTCPGLRKRSLVASG